jgi:hypothetical protein
MTDCILPGDLKLRILSTTSAVEYSPQFDIRGNATRPRGTLHRRMVGLPWAASR